MHHRVKFQKCLPANESIKWGSSLQHWMFSPQFAQIAILIIREDQREVHTMPIRGFSNQLLVRVHMFIFIRCQLLRIWDSQSVTVQKVQPGDKRCGVLLGWCADGVQACCVQVCWCAVCSVQVGCSRLSWGFVSCRPTTDFLGKMLEQGFGSSTLIQRKGGESTNKCIDCFFYSCNRGQAVHLHYGTANLGSFQTPRPGSSHLRGSFFVSSRTEQ